MEGVPFDCEQWQDPDHSAAQAGETALPTFEASKLAGAYLRQTAESLPEAAAAPLQEAAGTYERIVELLAPALADAGPESCPAIMGDEARQRKHVNGTLRPVRECLETIADHIDDALAVLGGDPTA